MSWPSSMFMGGHALYVLVAYALTLVVLGTEIALLVRRQKRWGDRGQAGARENARVKR